MSEAWLDGRLLVASPLLVDPNFFRTVVLMLQHDEDGALGVVLNRPTGELVASHLPDWADHLEDPPEVFYGGPVEPSVAIGVVRTELPRDPTPVPGVGLVDLESDPASFFDGAVRIFSGYAGWGPGQLESELTEGAWLVITAEPDDVFTHRPGGLWSTVLRRQGGRPAMLANYPIDPSLN